MKELQIRKAKLEDINRVMCITKQAYKKPYKENGFITRVKESRAIKKDFLDNKFFILVAVCDGKIVGGVRYVISNEDLYFSRLAVLKTYRGKGIASLLVDSVEKIALKNGCKKVLLDCAKEKELPFFYEKLGFVIDKVVKYGHYHGVYMYKIIK